MKRKLGNEVILPLGSICVAILMGICFGLHQDGSQLMLGNIAFCTIAVLTLPLFYFLIIGQLLLVFCSKVPLQLAYLYVFVSSCVGFKLGLIAVKVTIF